MGSFTPRVHPEISNKNPKAGADAREGEKTKSSGKYKRKTHI
jgi:hypothetical protein